MKKKIFDPCALFVVRVTLLLTKNFMKTFQNNCCCSKRRRIWTVKVVYLRTYKGVYYSFSSLLSKIRPERKKERKRWKTSFKRHTKFNPVFQNSTRKLSFSAAACLFSHEKKEDFSVLHCEDLKCTNIVIFCLLRMIITLHYHHHEFLNGLHIRNGPLHLCMLAFRQTAMNVK